MGPITNLPDIIFLCGFMGTGKSTIGEALAKKLLVPFRDLDDTIEKEAGKSIKKIFDEDGESVFRSMEKDLLLKIIKNCKGVLALGGGALQNQHIIDHVKINGLLIFIETPFSVILERISEKPDRPLLLDECGKIKEKNILEKDLKNVYETRLNFYRQAELTIQTNNHSSVDEIIAALVRKIRNHVSHY